MKDWSRRIKMAGLEYENFTKCDEKISTSKAYSDRYDSELTRSIMDFVRFIGGQSFVSLGHDYCTIRCYIKGQKVVIAVRESRDRTNKYPSQHWLDGDGNICVLVYSATDFFIFFDEVFG